MIFCAVLVVAISTQLDAGQVQPAAVDADVDAGAGEVRAPRGDCPVKPVYPPSERASGVGGTVELRLELDATGQVLSTEVSSSLGATFDAEALAYAAKCTFAGASVGPTPVASVMVLKVEMVPPLAPWVLEGSVVGELGQPLREAMVIWGEQRTTTDDEGHFRLTFEAIPGGDQWVTVHKDGYALAGFPEVFRAGQVTSVRYPLKPQRGFETRVEGSRLLPAVPDVDRTPQVSHFTIKASDIDRMPGALEDVARVVQGLPGVAADPDLLASFFVRGGGPDEVLFLIDGVPLSNPYHLGGFASIINPLMIDSADFYAGGSPARYEPTLSGVLDVKYAAPDVKRARVVADISMATAKARADVPLGVEGLSAVVSFRRSYFEAYFAVMKAFRLFGADTVAPDITEAMARVIYRRGAHRTMATFIHASDGLQFVIKPGEEVIVNFAGGLRLSNSSQIASLAHRIDLGGDSEVTFVGAFTRDQNVVDVSSARKFANDAARHEALFRADVTRVHSDHNRTGFGAQYAWRRLELTGEVTDTRAVAPWAQEPMVENDRPYADIAPAVTRHILSVYAEHTYKPIDALVFEGGGRAQYDLVGHQWTGSARLATAVTLPSATVLKISGGLALQPVQRPLLLDPTFGNPGLLPERSIQLIGAVEQPLPFEAVARLEVWSKWLGNLAVNPNSAAGLEARLAQGEPIYISAGSGLARGVDAMLIGRTRHFLYTLGLGVLWSERTNPLAEGAQTYPTQWEQRFTASGSVSWSPTSKWLLTARANFRSGRPYTPVVAFLADSANERWLPQFGATSSATYPFFFELSLRGERRFQWGPVACAVYFEVLNVTNTMNVFSYSYSKGDFANGVEPTRGAFNHLPIRPFLGLRGEY